MDGSPIRNGLSAIAVFAGAFLFQIGLVTLVIGFVSAIFRRWWLAAAAVIVAGLLIWPDVWHLLPPSSPVTIVSPRFRIMSMNVEGENRDIAALTSAIALASPDVLCVQEITPFQAGALLLPAMPNRLVYPHSGYDGMAIYSKYPLRLESSPVVGTPTSWPVRMLRAAVDVDGHEVEIVNVHLMAIMNRPQIVRNRFDAAAIVDAVKSEARPTIVIGDFNLTDRCPPLTPLLRLGFHDVQGVTAQGRGSTWPADRAWAAWLPGVRIDHVFLSPQLRATLSFVGGNIGSDHFPIWADVGVYRSR